MPMRATFVVAGGSGAVIGALLPFVGSIFCGICAIIAAMITVGSWGKHKRLVVEQDKLSEENTALKDELTELRKFAERMHPDAS